MIDEQKGADGRFQAALRKAGMLTNPLVPADNGRPRPTRLTEQPGAADLFADLAIPPFLRRTP